MYPGGVTAAYEFDFADRPLSLTVERAGLPNQVVASGALYEPSGPLGDLQLGNGLTENLGWTSRYFPQDIQVNGAATIFQWLYSTDFVGNPTAIADGLNAANNRTYDYQDFQYFLTQGDGPWGQQSWTYDKIGNRLTETKGAITDTYAYTLNGAGKNTALLDLITLGATGTRDYEYGLAGHLERVTAPGNEILFTSDAAGRLARLDRAAGDAAADFLYDGRSFLQTSKAGTVTEVFTDGFESGDASCWDGEFGATLNSGTADCSPKPETTPTYSSDGLLHAVKHRPDKFTESTRYYLHFAGRPIAQLGIPAGGGAGAYLWLTTDHLGTPVMATDAAGAVVWEGGFEPFGQDWSGASLAEIDLRFPGQWMDESWQDASEGARGYYNVHRWYETGVGRYSRKDPLFMREGVTNTYGYVDARPSVAIDPFGLFGLADLPNIPPGFGDFSAGLGDSLLFGLGDDLRSAFGIGGVNRCSGWYQGGEFASLFVGAGRLTYAGAAKAFTLVRYSRNLTRLQAAQRASAARNAIKGIFRGGIRRDYRNYPFPEIAEKYAFDYDLIITAAGRTDRVLNVGGAWLALGSLVNISDCTCP